MLKQLDLQVIARAHLTPERGRRTLDGNVRLIARADFFGVLKGRQC